MKGLKGKRVLLGGSAVGIGEEVAHRLAEEGVELFLGDIAEREMMAVAETLRSKGAKVGAQRYDLSDAASIEALVGAAAEFLGGLDGVANVAAAQQPEIMGNDNLLGDMDPAIWLKMLTANTVGTALVCKHALPHLVAAGGGSIVNVSSGASWFGEPTRPGYAASKAGINAFTRHIARAYGKQKVRANVISPGFVMTKTIEAMRGPEMEGWLDGVRAILALDRFGAPRDQAAGIAFLLSDDAEWVTGQAWNINGGSGFRD